MATFVPSRLRIVPDARGFTIIEVLLAAILLLIVFFGLVRAYTGGRRQLDFEEDRRKATAIAQAQMDGIRREFGYDDLPNLAGTDTSFSVDDRTFTVSHTVIPATPEAQATTISLTVTWTAKVSGAEVERTLVCTTILGRGMPW